MLRACQKSGIRVAKSLALILVFLALYAQEVHANHFRVFVNDTLVKTGTTIEVLPNSIVRYAIDQSSPGVIILDLTGDGTLKHTLYGSKVTFSTIYNDGNYKPQIKSDSEEQSFKLSVSPSLQVWTTEVTQVLPQIMWPLVTLSVFLILCIWGKLHNLVRSFRIGTIEVSGIKMISADLEVSLRQEIDKVVKNLEKKFPPEMTPQYIQFSDDPEADHDIHIIEFIQELWVKVQSAKAWNAVGNYYFYHDVSRAQKAYQNSILLAPEDPTPHINLGYLLYLRKTELYDAKKSFEEGIKVAKNRLSVPWANVGLSSIYGNLSRTEKDINQLEKITNKEKSHTSLAKMGFRRAIECNEADSWSYLGLGWCYSKENNYEEAIKYSTKALELKNYFIIARYNSASYKAKLGKFEESMEDFYLILRPMKAKLQALDIENDPLLKEIAAKQEFQQFLRRLDLTYTGR